MSFKLVFHPSVVSYDFRIAWTWKELENRGRWNANVNRLRRIFNMETIAYGEYKEWQSHWDRRRLLNLHY